MACDVASPFPDHMLENAETTNLDAIADFNATFGGGDGINPQIFSNTSTPHSDFSNPFGASGIDQTLSADPSTYRSTTDFPGPYYQSIETAPAFDASSLRYQTRQRSISEPPDGFAMHHRPPPFQPSQPAVTFHRGGHFLGDPQAQHPKSLKSLPKAKPHVRSSPYKTKPSPRQHEHPRYPLRRTQTQPVRPQAPTSVPGYPMRAQHPMAHMMGQPRVFEPMPVLQEQQFVSSRVCTPTPSRPAIDPALMGSPPSGPGRVEQFMVSLTTEQLRGMIDEAVQEALRKEEGTRGQNCGGQQSVGQAASDQEVEPEEECIRVADEREGGGDGEMTEAEMHAELFGEEPKIIKIDPFEFDKHQS